MKSPQTRLPVARHGTRSLYNRRKNPCRCTLCKEANRRYQETYKRKQKRGW